MPRFRLAFLAYNRPPDQRALFQSAAPHATRPLVTTIAGCVDADDARRKLRRLYDVAGITSTKEIPEP